MVSQADIEKTLEERHTKDVNDKLKKARVGIAGLGGLGSNIAMALARIGVGHLHLVDFDVVDLSNLNRQNYYLKHLGMKKTEALKSELLDINPYLDITTDDVMVTSDNLTELFDEDEIVCEAFDVPENKAMLVNGLLEAFPEKKIIAASGMAGYGKSNLIHTRQVMDNFFLCGDGVTDVSDACGLMAPRVMLCAAHEANLVVALVVGTCVKFSKKT